MDLIGYWKKCVLENYANFSGRARRAEFWSFALTNAIVYVLLAILMRVSGIFLILYVAFALAMLVPSIAVAIRRLHDTGKSGWMFAGGSHSHRRRHLAAGVVLHRQHPGQQRVRHVREVPRLTRR